MIKAAALLLLLLVCVEGQPAGLHCPIANCSASITCTNYPNGTDMPPRAIGIPVNYTKGYGLIHLAAGAYFLQDAILPFNVIFWVSTEGVILWDTSLTPAKITAGIREVTNLPIKVLIYSHSHADHIGNARDVIAEWGIQRVIAHHFINRTLTSWRDPRRPPPTESFRKAMTLTLGNQTVELTYKGEQHEEGNIWGWHQASKTLILFDVIYPGYVPVRGAPVTDFEGFLEAMNKTLEYDFDFYVGGHVNRPGTRDDVLKQIEFFNDVFVTIRDYSNQIPYTAVFPIIGPSTDTWKAFATYTELVNEDCFCRLAPKWKCVLGGFENYTRTACYLMSHYVRIDYTPNRIELEEDVCPCPQCPAPPACPDDSSHLIVVGPLLLVLFIFQSLMMY